jgi:hypothetical protein
MRALGAVLLFLLVAPVAGAQSGSKDAPPAPPKQTQYGVAPATPASGPVAIQIDPVKEADIRRLMDVVGTRSLMSEIMGNMEKNLRPTLTASLPPGDYRAKLIDLFLEKFGPRSQALIPKLIDVAVITYDKYLTDEDVKGLIAFYQTPIGQKMNSVLPKIVLEMQTQGQKLGEQAGRDTMMEVLSEHPEIVKAMTEQRSAPAPAPAK